MHRLRDILVLLVIVLALIFSARSYFGLRIDVENAAMKAVGTEYAGIAEEVEARFPRDHTLLFLLEPRREAADDPELAGDLARWQALLGALPAVRRVVALPARESGARLYALDVLADADGRYADRVQELTKVARRAVPTTMRFYATGQALGEIAIARALAKENQRVVPIILVALALLLAICYRSVVLVIGVLVPALGAIFLLGWVQSVLGLALDPISALLPPVLLSVGVAGAIHIVERFLAYRRDGVDAQTASRFAIRSMRTPAGLAVATTLAGFLGVAMNVIPAVSRFGLLAALGVAISCGLAFSFLPSWLSLCGGHARIAAIAEKRASWVGAGMRLAVFVRARAFLITTIGVVLGLLMAWSWTHLRVDTDPLRVLPASNSFRQATERVASHLGGIETFDLWLAAPAPAVAPLRTMQLMSEVLALDGVCGPADEVRSAADGSLLLRFLLAPAGSSARNQLFLQAEGRAVALGWQNAHATGAAVAVARDSEALVRGQWLGLAFTLCFLWVAMSLGFRSLRLGTLGLLPNVLPCLLLYGSLAAIDRPLSVGTAMIGSVLLGLVVDDTIHFLHSYGQARRRGAGFVTGMMRALRRSGRAIVVTSMVLALGFSAAACGELETTREFGILAAGTILVALLADLVLLPAIVSLPARRAMRFAG